jgi:hypothetical protein
MEKPPINEARVKRLDKELEIKLGKSLYDKKLLLEMARKKTPNQDAASSSKGKTRPKKDKDKGRDAEDTYFLPNKK